MTNLIDRLAMRATGTLPLIRPVPPPRFAAAPALASGERLIDLALDDDRGPGPSATHVRPR